MSQLGGISDDQGVVEFVCQGSFVSELGAPPRRRSRVTSGIQSLKVKGWKEKAGNFLGADLLLGSQQFCLDI